MKGFMDTLHSKISTKTHAKVEEVRVNVVDINEKVERLMTQHEEFKNDINTQLNFIKQQSTNIYENLSTQNAMIRGLEYHQLKMQECDEDIFDLKAKYSRISKNDKETNFESETEPSEENMDELFENFSIDDDEAFTLIPDKENSCTLKLTVIYSDNECFEVGEYFTYEETKCVYSSYQSSVQTDSFTVCTIGRVSSFPSNPDRIINDIAFNKEVIDPFTNEYTKGDLNVSNQHATILYNNGKYFLSDLGSTNSTFVQVLDEIVLREGMVFDIGKDNFIVITKIIMPNSYKLKTPDNATLDPYFMFIEGKSIYKEFKKLNTTRNRFYYSRTQKEQEPMIQLKFLKSSKSTIVGEFLDCISIFQKDINYDEYLWIGRSNKCFIQLTGDNDVSRKHCFLYLNHNNDWILNSANHDLFMSIRRDYEWAPALSEDPDNECEAYRDSSIPIVLKDGMQIRISDTCFKVKLDQ